MQKVAAYLLERRSQMNWPEARAAEAARLKSEIEQWLVSKGAKGLAPSGTYAAEDGGHATFEVQEATSGDQTWWMVRLEEVTNQGRKFVTAVSVTCAAGRVAVYVSLEVGSDASTVAIVEADARCPKIVRQVLAMPGQWFHGECELFHLRRLSGFDAGESLVAELKSPARTVPVIALSEDHDGLALPGLDKQLEFDTAGLANVVVLDSDAAWAVTDGLRKWLSCFGGAVRLYWPKLGLKDDPFRHPLWTRQRLRSFAEDAADTSDRFRRQIRRQLMRASALGVVRPPEIDAIRAVAREQAFADMKAKATSLQDYAVLAESYAKDNEDLRSKVDKLTETNTSLQLRMLELDEEKQMLVQRVQNAEAQLQYTAPPPKPQEIPPEAEQPDEGESTEPEPGEVRFYKKVHAAPTHDVMQRVGDCGHIVWQNSHGADKARKGIAKLESGRTDWKKLQHCGSCTGGGVWKVKW